MNKRNILITGGAGFIGSHLVDRLLAEGDWKVTVIDNFNDFYSPVLKWRNIKYHLQNQSYQLLDADICNRTALEQVFERNHFDAIVHLAACAGVRPSIERPDLYVETNVNGTLNLLEKARRFGVKQFVFASSSSVYGANCRIPFSETDKTAQPISPYAATKAAGELLCHTYSHLYDIRTICLRFFTVYGARQRPDLAIHKFAHLISNGLPIYIFGDGTTKRDYTYIDDIIAGVGAAIDYDKTNYEIFNLGESRTVELIELVKILEHSLEKTAIIKSLPPQPGDVPQTCANIDKARKLLSYNPQVNIEKGIHYFAEWFKNTRPFSEQRATKVFASAKSAKDRYQATSL